MKLNLSRNYNLTFHQPLNQLWFWIGTLFLLLYLAFLNPLRIEAATTHSLTLNELYPSPPTGQKEWLEIYNLTTETISLEGWSVAELAGGQVKNHEQIFGLNDEISIPPGDFLVMENKKITLNNSGDTIYLINHQGEIVDSVTYGPIKEKSYARQVDGTGEWVVAEANPGQSNQTNNNDHSPAALGINYISTSPLITTPSNTSSQNGSQPPTTITLQLSEIMACPLTGETEWLEIHNASDGDWQMDGWRVKNSKGASRIIREAPIKKNSLNIIEFSSGLLGNSGDSVTLETDTGEVILNAEYPACINKNSSFVFDGDHWQETTSVTKGKTNIWQKTNNSSHLKDLVNQIVNNGGNLETSTVLATSANSSDNPDQTKASQTTSTDQASKNNSSSKKATNKPTSLPVIKTTLTPEEEQLRKTAVSPIKADSTSPLGSQNATTASHSSSKKTILRAEDPKNSPVNSFSVKILALVSVIMTIVGLAGYFYLQLQKHFIDDRTAKSSNSLNSQTTANTPDSQNSNFDANSTSPSIPFAGGELAFGDLF